MDQWIDWQRTFQWTGEVVLNSAQFVSLAVTKKLFSSGWNPAKRVFSTNLYWTLFGTNILKVWFNFQVQAT